MAEFLEWLISSGPPDPFPNDCGNISYDEKRSLSNHGRSVILMEVFGVAGCSMIFRLG